MLYFKEDKISASTQKKASPRPLKPHSVKINLILGYDKLLLICKKKIIDRKNWHRLE